MVVEVEQGVDIGSVDAREQGQGLGHEPAHP